MDRKANSRFYGSSSMSPEKIFASSPNIAPNAANSFVQMLTAQTQLSPTSPNAQSATASTSIAPQQVPAEEQSEVRTFGMPDPED